MKLAIAIPMYNIMSNMTEIFIIMITSMQALVSHIDLDINRPHAMYLLLRGSLL